METETHDPSSERETFGDMFDNLKPEEVETAIDSTIAEWEDADASL